MFWFLLFHFCFCFFAGGGVIWYVVVLGGVIWYCCLGGCYLVLLLFAGGVVWYCCYFGGVLFGSQPSLKVARESPA